MIFIIAAYIYNYFSGVRVSSGSGSITTCAIIYASQQYSAFITEIILTVATSPTLMVTGSSSYLKSVSVDGLNPGGSYSAGVTAKSYNDFIIS